MDKQEIPTLVTLLFGDKAKLAIRATSPRLMRWCQAFDDWLEERRGTCQLNTYKKSLGDWKRVLERMGKYPWDISQAEVKAYIAWREKQGMSPTTVNKELSSISMFYRWCRQHHVDAENGEIIDPTKGVPKPKVRKYARAKVLSGEEVWALLAVLRLDEAILTKRDYAFFLARLRLGMPHKQLQQLRWGQIERREIGVLVNWGGGEGESGGRGDRENEGGSERAAVPGDIYEAIVDYLRAAGRLEGMRAEAYVFAPLVDPLRQGASGGAQAWDEGRYVSTRRLWDSLKRYGRLAGIAHEKLTLRALRHTATMMRVEAGDSLEEIQEFLQCGQAQAKRYLKALPLPEANAEGLRNLEEDPPQFPEREPYRYEPWGGMTHGMRARCQPPEEVAAVLAEDIRGMEEEMVGVRLLNRGLLNMLIQTTDPVGVALLTDAYSRAAMRLGQMIQIEEAMKKRRPEEDWAEQFLARLAEGARERGEAFDIEAVKDEAWGGEGAMAANARRLAEEIAGTRLVLRRTFQLAMESETPRRRAYLADVYGRGCRRLVKLLQLEGYDQTRLKIYINQVIEDVIIAINEEWGLK